MQGNRDATEISMLSEPSQNERSDNHRLQVKTEGQDLKPGTNSTLYGSNQYYPRYSYPRQSTSITPQSSYYSEVSYNSSSNSSWNWINTTPSNFDHIYFGYETNQQQQHQKQQHYHHPPAPTQSASSGYYDHHHGSQQPPSPISLYGYPTAVNTQQPYSSIYYHQLQRKSSSDVSELKSPMNYDVLPPITHNNVSPPPTSDPYAYNNQSKASTNQHTQYTQRQSLRPPPQKIRHKSLTIGKNSHKLRNKASESNLKSRSKNSPSYLLDSREPDSNGFVNYDARDSQVIMAAVAPSGNFKKKRNSNNKISKRPSNASLNINHPTSLSSSHTGGGNTNRSK